MKRKYAKIMFLSMTLLTSSITTAYATIPEDEKKEETQKVTEDAHLPLMIINGTNKSEHFFISSESLTNKCAKRVYCISICDTCQQRQTKSNRNFK